MKARGRRLGPFLAALGLTVALALGLWWGFLSNILDRPVSPLPPKIAYLSLVSSTSGGAALAQISQLHGLDLELSTGYVGEYRGGGERLTAWVGVAPSEKQATELVRRMTEGIQDGNPAFSHAGVSEMLGIAVHRIQGGGETSYYFSKGKEVIWLTIASAQPQKLVEEALRAWK